MDFAFGKSSQEKLATCDAKLQELFNEVIKHFDCTIMCGVRGRKEQDEAFELGISKAKWGESAHNFSPSKAVDVVPYPIDWNDKERFYYFAGFVMGTATKMGIKIKWGGDWDMDNNLKDQSFFDLPHFELVG